VEYKVYKNKEYIESKNDVESLTFLLCMHSAFFIFIW